MFWKLFVFNFNYDFNSKQYTALNYAILIIIHTDICLPGHKPIDPITYLTWSETYRSYNISYLVRTKSNMPVAGRES